VTRRLRVDFLTPPFSGHLHPALAMAQILSPHYDVRIISTPGAAERIRTAGFRSVMLMAGVDGTLRSIASPPRAVKGNPLRMHRQFQQALKLLIALGSQITELYQTDPPDLLIADFTLPTGGLAAQRLGIPWWTSLPSPCVLETPDGPPAYLGGLPIRDNLLGTARDAAGRTAVRWFKLLLFRMYRGPLRKAGLQRVYRGDGSESVYSPERILALGLPQLEFAKQWPVAVRFVGPMLYTPPTGSPTPEFRAGCRHVLVTLGTHLEWHKNAVADAVREIAPRFPDVMFHFSDGTLDHSGSRVDGNFTRLSFVDYQRWLPRYDLVFHHGGAGIMYYCIANARPAVVYPIDYDQFDHAARLSHAGLALRLHRIGDLEATLRRALNDVQLPLRCASFRESCKFAGNEHPLLELLRLRFAD
jgi:UDP:flavonoid glycosyltransferase YjiC (YdhE family)